MSIGPLTLLEDLGRGAYGNVKKCVSTTGKHYAIKVSNSAFDSESIQHEDFILRYLHRDPKASTSHIIQRYGIEKLPDNKIGLVLELLGLSLARCIHAGIGQSLATTRGVTEQLARACDFIHGSDMIHSDIKPGNILISFDKNSVKLADFGAAFLKDPAHRPSGEIQTLWYRSPDVILGQAPTPAIDIWSLAVSIAEIYIGRIIFPVNDDKELVAYHHFRLEKQHPDSLVEKASPVGQRTFKDGQTERIPATNTLSQLILNHSRLKKDDTEETRQFISLLEKMLDYNPESRFTAAEIPLDPFISKKTSPVSSTEKQSDSKRPFTHV